MTTYSSTAIDSAGSSGQSRRSERADSPLPNASGESTPLFDPSGPRDPSSPELDHALHRLGQAPYSADQGAGASRRDDEQGPLLGAEGAGEDEEVVVEGEDRATRFVWVLVSAAAISGLLFGASKRLAEVHGLITGYDTGVISGGLV